MKRKIALIASLILISAALLSLISCNIGGIIPDRNEQTENEDAVQVNYDDVIGIYRKIVGILPEYVDSKDANERYAEQLEIADADTDIFDALLSSCLLYYPGLISGEMRSPANKLAYGYTLKDLNSDGTDELSRNRRIRTRF